MSSSASMDRGTKSSKSVAKLHNKLYMDLKDIIRENALQFLPAKSVRRCTSVCRDWKLQVSTPFFAHNQSNSFHDVSGYFCLGLEGNSSFIPLDPMAYGVPDQSLRFMPEAVDIRCSSNGLLCCQSRTGSGAYYICNPVTQQWKKLPQHAANHGPDPAVVLIFEPSLLKFVPEYKLVCAFPSDLDGYEFEIYSSKEGSWRISPEIVFGNRHINPKSGVHVSGVVYWQAQHSSVLAFDLVSERTTLQYDGIRYSYSDGSSFGAMNGKLCSASVYNSKLRVQELSNSYTNTMEMNSKARAWKVKEIALDCSQINVSQHGHYEVKFINDDMVVIRAGDSLFSYKMKTKEMKQFASGIHHTNVVLVPYVNSLVEI